MKDSFERFLTFTKSERIAILTIIIVIVILLTTKYLLIINPPRRTAYFHNLDSIVESQQRQIDSLLALDSIKNAERKAAYKKSRKESSNWKTKTGKSVTKTETQKKGSNNYQLFTAKEIPIIDINIADTTLLKVLPDIGSSFARRIVEYREKLGGFIDREQLLEVYGMDSTRFKNIVEYVEIDSIFTPNKLKINYDSFKVLNRHPYLKYEDVKKIVNHREQKGLITSWEQLERIVGDGIEMRLMEYVEFE